MVKNKKILITGGTGLLGTHLIRTAPKEVNVYATVHEYKKVPNVSTVKYLDLDVRNKSDVDKVIDQLQPDVVIHTAAHGRVDFCEANPEDAKKTNVDSTTYLVSALNKYGGKIIFCSTNMVFDGHHPLYDESSLPTPQTVYGQTKVASEEHIKQIAQHYIIFRLMTMYGWNWQPERKNMISMAIEKLSSNQELWMTNDVFNNMLYVHQAAHTFWKAIEANIDQEVVHLSGSDCINRYETTKQVCEVFQLNSSLVHEVGSEFFKGQEVPRSPNTCFRTNKAETLLQFHPLRLKDGLSHMKAHPVAESVKEYETR